MLHIPGYISAHRRHVRRRDSGPTRSTTQIQYPLKIRVYWCKESLVLQKYIILLVCHVYPLHLPLVHRHTVLYIVSTGSSYRELDYSTFSAICSISSPIFFNAFHDT
jgi:hypothetical protein